MTTTYLSTVLTRTIKVLLFRASFRCRNILLSASSWSFVNVDISVNFYRLHTGRLLPLQSHLAPIRILSAKGSIRNAYNSGDKPRPCLTRHSTTKSPEIKPLTMMLDFISVYSNFIIDINCDLNPRACKTLNKYSCETQLKALVQRNNSSRDIVSFGIFDQVSE